MARVAEHRASVRAEMSVLPNLVWNHTTSRGPRGTHPLDLVVVHRWGVRYISPGQEAKSYEGVVNYFDNPQNKASAHVVYPGSVFPAPGQATQMVAWGEYAWAEAAYNPVATDVESADAIWLGQDDAGLAQLARIVAFLLASGGGLHKPFDGHELPALWSTRRGVCRHADLGQAGGGHTACPTTDLALWRHFVKLVQNEYLDGQTDNPFRFVWGRK